MTAPGTARRLLIRDHADSVSERMVTLSPAVAEMLPLSVCSEFHILPVEYSEGFLTVAATRDDDVAARIAIKKATDYEPRFVIADKVDIDEAIIDVYAQNGTTTNAGNGATFTVDDLVAHGLAIPPRLGEQLAGRGLVTEEQLGEAVAEQQKTGGRIGEVLVHGGALEEKALLRVLSEQMDMPTVDLSEFDASKAPQDVIPEPLARQLLCVPIAADADTAFVAVPDRLSAGARTEIARHTDLNIQEFLAPRNDIEALLRRIHSEAYSETATDNLRQRFPETSAHEVLSGFQKAFLGIVAVLIIIFLIWQFTTTLVVIFALASIFYTLTSLYKLVAGYSALEHRYLIDTSPEALDLMDERTLPMYTILVPLFREAAVIPYLVQGINSLDYPKTKLDVRLLCEEEDDETYQAIIDQDLPPHFNPIIVPASDPQTKPKACNYGLQGAKGEYVVIYDAEDRPDPAQLKKAVLMFDNVDESIVCIQAKLNFFNQQTNFLTRWFSIEYSMLFDLVLPGLDARKDPIPLGGTSNHIKLKELVEVGAWDPYNVTEDADLGVRLHQAGYRTTMMNSTTYEEANTEIGNWVRQRSRWSTGYIQTWLVYMRHPFGLLKSVGFKGFVSFQLLIGGTFIFLINPFFWFLTTVFALTQAGFIQDLFPGWVYYLAAAQLFIGNFVFMYLGMAAAVRRGDDNLAAYALFLPFYWGLMSVAAWKGFAQLITTPFHWETTEHGLDLDSGGTGRQN